MSRRINSNDDELTAEEKEEKEMQEREERRKKLEQDLIESAKSWKGDSSCS